MILVETFLMMPDPWQPLLRLGAHKILQRLRDPPNAAAAQIRAGFATVALDSLLRR
jgi:hypothetical protein